jgi:hypothetical protein
VPLYQPMYSVPPRPALHADRGRVVRVPQSGSLVEQEVVEAARRRATALATKDEDTLRLMMHPDLQWTNYQGNVLSYEEYIEGNSSVQNARARALRSGMAAVTARINAIHG